MAMPRPAQPTWLRCRCVYSPAWRAALLTSSSSSWPHGIERVRLRMCLQPSGSINIYPSVCLSSIYATRVELLKPCTR